MISLTLKKPKCSKKSLIASGNPKTRCPNAYISCGETSLESNDITDLALMKTERHKSKYKKEKGHDELCLKNIKKIAHRNEECHSHRVQGRTVGKFSTSCENNFTSRRSSSFYEDNLNKETQRKRHSMNKLKFENNFDERKQSKECKKGNKSETNVNFHISVNPHNLSLGSQSGFWKKCRNMNMNIHINLSMPFENGYENGSKTFRKNMKSKSSLSISSKRKNKQSMGSEEKNGTSRKNGENGMKKKLKEEKSSYRDNLYETSEPESETYWEKEFSIAKSSNENENSKEDEGYTENENVCQNKIRRTCLTERDLEEEVEYLREITLELYKEREKYLQSVNKEIVLNVENEKNEKISESENPKELIEIKKSKEQEKNIENEYEGIKKRLF